MTDKTIMEHFPIGVLADLTGIAPSTLRTWERRYGILRPGRTDGRHRLYSAADVATINRLKVLRREGRSMRSAANALRMELQSESDPVGVDEILRRRDGDVWSGYQAYVLDAVHRFSATELDACYTTLLGLHQPETVVSRVLMPVLETLGERLDGQSGGIAEEHFLTAYVRNRLGARFLWEHRAAKGPLVCLACLPGEHHELGLLHFALVLIANAIRPLYLGPDLPIKEIGPAVERTGSNAVVLSGTMTEPEDHVWRELGALRGTLDVGIFIGGPVSTRHANTVDRHGLTAVGGDYRNASKLVACSLRAR